MFIKLNSQIQEIANRQAKLSKSIKKKTNQDKLNKSKGLTKLYLIALSAVAGLSVLGQALIQSILSEQFSNSNKIERASNQRTLSQQLSKAALVIDFATDPFLENQSLIELEQVTQQLKQSHTILKQNNNSQTVTELFAEIESNYESLINSAEGLIELIEKEQSGASISPSLKRVLVKEIVRKENRFSEGMNQIALQYAKEAKDRVYKLKKIECFLLIVTLLVLVLEALFIFRPAVTKIVTTVEELLVTQTELESSQARYIAIIENQTELICRFLPDRTISFVNQAFCNYFIQDKVTAIGQRLDSLNCRYNFDLLSENIDELTPERPTINIEHSVFNRHNSTSFLQWINCGIFNSKGDLIEIQSVGRDITESKRAESLAREKIKLETEIRERKKSEAALKIAEEKYRNIFENAVEGLFQISSQGHLLSYNPALIEILGCYQNGTIDKNFDIKDKNLYVDRTDYNRLRESLKEKETISQFELQIYRLDRSKIWISVNIRTVRDSNGNISRYEGSAIDITEQKQAREQLMKSALYDNLTDLPNRILFMERLNKQARSAKQDNDLFAVLFVDLDRFKAVNDTLGHEVGDRLLIEISRRLESAVRSQDTVCRWGGDEFVILLNSIATKDDALRVGDRIQQKLTLPLTVDEHQLFPSGSVGIALSSSGYQDAEDLLRNADAAMYQAKAKGKSQYYLFDPVGQS